MTKRIEWDVPRPTLRMRLLVEKSPLEDTTQYGSDVSPATLDDLRKACEAVGLHVVDRVVFDAIVAKGERAALRATNLSNDLQGLRAHRNNLESEVVTLRAQLAEAEAQHAATQDATLAKSAYINKLEAQLAAITPTDGPATDGDLLAMAGDAYRLRSREDATLDDMRKLALAVAARVRRERGECLVERLVESGISWQVAKAGKFQRWISIDGKTPVYVSCADVPVTLARLAGLDGGR